MKIDIVKTAVIVVGIVYIMLMGVMFYKKPSIAYIENKKIEKHTKDNSNDLQVNPKTKMNENKNIRSNLFAGSFYSSNPEELEKEIKNIIESIDQKEIESDIKALILPHAGYIYSGPTAGHGIKTLNKKYDKIWIIGSNHSEKADFQGISVPGYSHYQTPLGEMKVSNIVNKLKQDFPLIFTTDEEAHKTHIIETELPFLQYKLGNEFEIIPLVTSYLNDEEIKKIADIIESYIDEDSLIIISSDLSHYHDNYEASKKDKNCIDNIASMDSSKIQECEACGVFGISILNQIALNKGWKNKLLDYRHSGNVNGDNSRVVGYGSFAYFQDNNIKNQIDNDSAITKEQERFLLDLARKNIESYISQKKIIQIDKNKIDNNLKEIKGCFVTINKGGELRGCIGHIVGQLPLIDCVLENSINAGFNDPRFKPLEKDELKDIKIEISILTTPKKINYIDEYDLLDKLTPGKDGVVIEYQGKSSTYLPQVWEQIKDKELFLESLCEKQGSEINCWKKGANILTYRVYKFEEK